MLKNILVKVGTGLLKWIWTVVTVVASMMLIGWIVHLFEKFNEWREKRKERKKYKKIVDEIFNEREAELRKEESIFREQGEK